jgi:hypothetical protein
MKTRLFFLFIAASMVCIFSCKKNNTSATPLPLSHWTINGVSDSSSTASAANNMNFICLTNDQKKSISVNFFSGVTNSYTYKVSDALTANTECTISVNDGDTLIYTSTGIVSDSLHENFSNNIITLTFNNITVHNNINTTLVSGVLSFKSVY